MGVRVLGEDITPSPRNTRQHCIFLITELSSEKQRRGGGLSTLFMRLVKLPKGILNFADYHNRNMVKGGMALPEPC